MSKILVFSTSLRSRSNSEFLTEKMTEGIREAGHEVETISLKGKNLKFCTGCLVCQKTQKCVLNDDAVWIAEKVKMAEDESSTPERAVSGLQGWIDCFPKARLAGTLFCGGLNDAGEAAENSDIQEKAYRFGKAVM